METSAGNTVKDIDHDVNKEGGCVPNLRGASPVGRGDGGLPYAARSNSKAIQERVVGVDEVGVARNVTRMVVRT